MNRFQHPSNNSVLGAPPGASPDECIALPITRAVFPTGEDVTISFWKPSPAELSLMLAGNTVRLAVMARTHPPLAIGVDGDGVIELLEENKRPA